ncbi:hypothetical protein GY486_004386 [Escherichia coli]|nr:hypothetical protein [Escherichia coli]
MMKTLSVSVKSLFRILCKCLFSEVTVQAVTELDNLPWEPDKSLSGRE